MSDPTLPRVSIVTPSYNQAAFLEETIQSVLSQDYPNLEYIVIDGGSTDGSVEIIEQYVDRLAYWTSEDDSGQADAINKGLARATGEIVAWLNSDDTYLPGAIHAAVEALQDNPDCGLVYGDVLAVDGEGQPTNLIRYEDWGLDGLLQFKIIGQPAVFMRRDVLVRAGQLDTSFHFLLDHQLWLRIAEYSPIRYVPQKWATARFHEAAKNVAQAEHFCADADAIVAWVQTRPDLAKRYAALGGQAKAGLALFKAYYLSTGHLAWPALKEYTKAFFAAPLLALREWKRILWTAGSLFGLGRIRGLDKQLKGKAVE